MEPGRLRRTGGEDAELIAACRAGDTGAFGEIVARYQPAVVAVAYAAVRDRVLAEDIAQDAFVTAWTKLAGLRDVERLPAWLCGIARNLARARRRTLRREEPAEVDVAGDTTPYDALDERQIEAALVAALARVPEAYREPLVLFYCEQQSAREVARMLGLSDAAVHQRLSRGRALLAGDAKLLEHAPSRSRRDLAAAVLAAIALGVGSSRVEASPRGTRPMLKLAAVAIATSLAAGMTYVVAHGTSSSSGDAAASPAADPAAARTPYAAASHARAFHVPQPPVLVAQAYAAAHAGGAPPSLDCHATAEHMASIAVLGDGPYAEQDPARKREMAEEAEAHFEARCAIQSWSQELMGCVLGSADFVAITFDCAPYAPAATPNPPASMPELRLETRKDALAPSADISCEGVAQHMLQLTDLDPASEASVPPEEQELLDRGVNLPRVDLVGQIVAACKASGWTEDHRRCLASAPTAAAVPACE